MRKYLLLVSCSLVFMFVVFESPPQVARCENTDKTQRQLPKTEEEEWEDAVWANTVKLLDAYLTRYPSGKYANITKEFKRALENDLSRREEDKRAYTHIKDGNVPDFSRIAADKLGADYALWRSLTSNDCARILFETPTPNVESQAKGRRLNKSRKWPPKDWPPPQFQQAAVIESVMKYLPYRCFYEWPPKPGAQSREYTGWQCRPQGLVFGNDINIIARVLNGHGLVILTPTTADRISMDGSGMQSAMLVPTGQGSVHIFTGIVEILGLRFESTQHDLLRFVIDKNGDYVHIGGKGSVRTQDGKLLFRNEP